jgi:hypothetical protein
LSGSKIEELRLQVEVDEAQCSIGARGAFGIGPWSRARCSAVELHVEAGAIVDERRVRGKHLVVT